MGCMYLHCTELANLTHWIYSRYHMWWMHICHSTMDVQTNPKKEGTMNTVLSIRIQRLTQRIIVSIIILAILAFQYFVGREYGWQCFLAVSALLGLTAIWLLFEMEGGGMKNFNPYRERSHQFAFWLAMVAGFLLFILTIFIIEESR